jgi:hypothetical protein
VLPGPDLRWEGIMSGGARIGSRVKGSSGGSPTC